MRYLAVVVLALPLLVRADGPLAPIHPAPSRAASQAQELAARYSADELAALGRALAAQIAVRDAVEQSMRAPTPEEAAALANTATSPAQVLNVPGGGTALRGDASMTSFSMARRDADGTIHVTRGRAAATAPVQGVPHVR